MAGLVIPYQSPIVECPSTAVTLLLAKYTAHAHVNLNDIVTLGVVTAGQIDPAVTNDNSSLLLGIAQHDSDAVYNQHDTGAQGVFGASPVGTGLLPSSPDQTMVALFSTPNSVVAINLTQSTGWVSGGAQQANVGTQVGLLKDGTTGLYVADPTASHKVATIQAKVQGITTQLNNGQTSQPFGEGGVGDLGARVYITFFPSVLAVVGGL